MAIKWDLKCIYDTKKHFENDLQKLKEWNKKIPSYKGKLDNKEDILSYYKFCSEYSRLSSRVGCYAYLNHDIALDDDYYIKKMEEIESVGVEAERLSAFVMPELVSLSEEFLLSLKEDKDFALYTHSIESILKDKKHTLSEEVEYALALTESFLGGFCKVRDFLMELEMTYAPVIVDGESKELTDANYVKFLTNENRSIRENAYNNMYKSIKQFKHTIASLFINDLKADSFDLKLRNYNNLLEASLEAQEIPKNIYYSLIKYVNDNNHLMQRYFTLLGKYKGIDKVHFYDVYTTISKPANNVFDFDKQKKLALEVVKVYGREYVKHFKYLLENRVDVEPASNKAGGAYCLHLYDEGEFVLLNNVDDFSSLSTLLHEMGHAMHSYYSINNQPYELSDYSIYVAEIASTMNEILLNDYMRKHTKDVNEKIYYIEQMILLIKSTIFRQTMFSEFEEYAHSMVEKDMPLTVDSLTEKYKELLQNYFGDSVQVDDNIVYEWMRIPHFYRAYYVYKYATSLIVAINVGNKILQGDENLKKKYINMLKSGGCDYPNNLLLELGIDLSSNEPYEYVFDYLKKLIDELEYLLNKK